MLYKFRSKAAGDVIMLAANGEQVLRILGREPAAKGIFEVADLPAAMLALEAAVLEDERVRREAKDQPDAPATRESAITLRQRAWPLLEMMKRSHAARVDVVWGA
jgi:hypothetical protein